MCVCVFNYPLYYELKRLTSSYWQIHIKQKYNSNWQMHGNGCIIPNSKISKLRSALDVRQRSL